jgi:hypothetical protein
MATDRLHAIGQGTKTCQRCGGPFIADDLPNPKQFKKQKFCGLACYRASRKLTPAQKAIAFWAKVRKAEGCWPYLGASIPDGYGWVSWRGTQMGAHRVAWILTHGEIPKGMHVLHRCDNRRCVNPDHLFLGTHLDNMADMYSKGRNTRGALAKAKITEAQAIEILKAKPAEVRGSWRIAEELAARTGITAGAVACIWRGDSWAYLQKKETTV